MTGPLQQAIIPIGKIHTATPIGSPKQLGVLIKARRKELGVSQVELAGLSGVGPRLVGEIESGKETAQIGKVLRLLDRLGLVTLIAPRRR